MAVIYFDNGAKNDGLVVKSGQTAYPQRRQSVRLTTPVAPATVTAPPERGGVTAIVRIPQ